MNDIEMYNYMQDVRAYSLEKHKNEIAIFSNMLSSNPQDNDARYKRGMLYLNVGQIENAKKDLTLLLNSNSKVVDFLWESIKSTYVLYDFPSFLPPVISKLDYNRLFSRMTGPAMFKVESENIPQALILYNLFYSDIMDSVAEGLLINTSLDNFKAYSENIDSDSSDIYHKFAVALIKIKLTKDAIDPDITIDLNWQKNMLQE